MSNMERVVSPLPGLANALRKLQEERWAREEARRVPLRRMVPYTFPLRPHDPSILWARMTLPEDLSREEVARLSAILATLAVDEDWGKTMEGVA